MTFTVRSHAASQTHKELPCWTFSHYASDNKVSSGIENYERHAQLIFRESVASSVGYGCGYGNVDTKIEHLTTNTVNEKGTSGGSYTLHGFLGTFHCVLYESSKKEEIVISIAPESFSTGMYSWFPLFFPLREPMIVSEDDSLKCNIWRKTDSKSVWYEWCAEVVDEKNDRVKSASNLHNPNGRSSKILL